MDGIAAELRCRWGRQVKKEKLGRFEALMLLVTGVLFADSVASNASAGTPALTWWVILGITYMLPMGAIIGELSQAMPDEGGIYVWVSEGLGRRWGALVGWIYFFCGLFIPSSAFIMMSDVFFTLFFPTAPFTLRVCVAIALVWIMGFASTLPMAESSWMTNAAGVIKIVLYLLVFTAGIVYVLRGNAPANSFDAASLVPTPGQSLTFLPVIVYCCSGMELASASAEQFDDPARMLPRVILGMVVMNVVFNMIAATGMLLVLPVDAIDLDLGFLDVLSTLLGSGALLYGTALCFLFSLFAQTVAWVVGGNRGACESAKAGELPRFLGVEKNDQPFGAIITTCIVSTLFLALYALLAGTASDLFFSLMSCGVLSTLLPYVLMVAAYQHLRHAGRIGGKGTFHCPAGITLSWVVQIIQCLTLCLMIYVPGAGWNSAVVTNVFGAVTMVGIGWTAVSACLRKARQENRASSLDE